MSIMGHLIEFQPHWRVPKAPVLKNYDELNDFWTILIPEAEFENKTVFKAVSWVILKNSIVCKNSNGIFRPAFFLISL